MGIGCAHKRGAVIGRGAATVTGNVSVKVVLRVIDASPDLHERAEVASHAALRLGALGNALDLFNVLRREQDFMAHWIPRCRRRDRCGTREEIRAHRPD